MFPEENVDLLLTLAKEYEMTVLVERCEYFLQEELRKLKLKLKGLSTKLLKSIL